MALSGLPFCFDIVVEELKSFVYTKQFVIKSQFADIFSVVLNNPPPTERKRKCKKSKGKVKRAKKAKGSAEAKKKALKGQTLVYVGNIDILMSHMMEYPMEICLCRESDPEERIGSTLIPWHPSFIEYLIALYDEIEPPPAIVRDVHNIFDEATSKRMAAIRINIKLRLTQDLCWDQYRVLSDKYPLTYILEDIDSENMNRPWPIFVDEGPGIIKTKYSGGKQKKISSTNKRNGKRLKHNTKQAQNKDQTSLDHINNYNKANKINKSIFKFVRSSSDISKTRKVQLFHSKSCTAIHINPLDYIFGDRMGPCGKNNIYTVGYVTVHNSNSKSPSEMTVSPQTTQSQEKSNKSSDAKSSDPNLTATVKCEKFECEYKKRPHLEIPDDRVFLGLNSLDNPCCITDTIQAKMEITSTVTGNIMVNDDDPCFCACECSFGFERKTTYCRVCGGYEKLGTDLDGTPQYLMPDPCPDYHKITRIKPGSNSGSESKKEAKKRAKSPEREDDKKKGKDDRFKFNYGYKGIPPQIGHSQCALPCTGTLSNVPKHMGWLWTADNIPGLMFRPAWKPGAINKVVAMKLRMAKNPGEVISKRRKAAGLKKRPLKRPLLIVHKKDGEYNVTMETMKPYAKPRTINQPPYEDKPVVTYTIGRTEEENLYRKKRKEAAMRRVEREKREFIQSAFRDMCHEICMKTYQQALGLLPDSEDPECTCYPALPGPDRVNLERTCSCSDIQGSTASDTDSDEWILEFTPPTAFYDAAYPGTKVKTGDKETQYTYLDYRVKLFDKYGNPVPRFFKGPDGKQQCSDLGGFWSPDHNWLEINVDGYIAPDGRWAPMIFIGPNGEQVDTDTGKFQAANGTWLMVGVDGYIDINNKWKFYKRMNKPQQTAGKPKYAPGAKPTTTPDTSKKTKKKESEPQFSCFGDATPVELSKMGIVGHGPDKKTLNRILKEMIAKGVDVRIPEGLQVPRFPGRGRSRQQRLSGAMDAESFKCRHSTPSRKGLRPDFGYFRTKKYKSPMPKERIHDLEEQGRSLSAFHKPCFHSNLDYRKRPKRREVTVRMHRAHAGDYY